MTEMAKENLMSQLPGVEASPDKTPYVAVEAASSSSEGNPEADQRVNEIIERIKQLTASPKGASNDPYAQSESPYSVPPVQSASVAATSAPVAPLSDDPFVPCEPESFAEAGLSDTEVEMLIMKYLLSRGDSSGRDIADHIKLPFVLVSQLLSELKNQQLVGHRGAATMNDFQYQLTDLGRERARKYAMHCTYFGAAPVSLCDYIDSVAKQSLTGQHPTAEDLGRAFDDLVINKRMLDRLGPAINSGRGLFLFGPPGNGKTSIAERMTAAFGHNIWIPRAIGIDGEIIRVFDPVNHDEVPLPANDGLLDQRKIDRRWVRIRRPTIIAGGELSMSQLEVSSNAVTGISEAPLQMKSNCGTLVIDDFGRQRMRIDELLNRWIVPLEKRLRFSQSSEREEN